MTPSERLALKLELVRVAYGLPGRLLVEHPRARERFPAYLAAGRHVAIGMIGLMETAHERARALAPEDRVAAGLAPYLERHIVEELHGGAPGAGILDDLAALGADSAAVRAEPPPATVAALVAAVDGWIRDVHPVAVLGFLQLEAFPPDAGSIERLIARTGLPREGFRQLLLHAAIDGGHARELAQLIDALPLQPWHERLIGLAALTTIARLTETLLDVVEDGARAQPARSEAL